MRRALPLLLALAACDRGPQNWRGAGALWTPGATVATPSGLYVQLTGGRLSRVTPEGATPLPEIPGVIRRVLPDAGGDGVLVFSDAQRCEGIEDPQDQYAAERFCEDAGGDWRSDLWLTRVGETVGEPISLPMPYAAAIQSGDRLLLWWDPTSELVAPGIINLTSALSVDLAAGTVSQVSLGFTPNAGLFVGAGERALVASDREVSLVDVASGATAVRFPLTLSTYDTVGTDLLAITPDGRYALVPATTVSDLYVLDLDLHTINMIEMPRNVRALHVDAAHDSTLIAADADPGLSRLDHASFSLREIGAPRATDLAAIPGGEVLAWHEGSRAVSRLNLDTNRVVDYLTQGVPRRVDIAPDGSFAVVVSGDVVERFDSGYNEDFSGASTVDVLDLRGDDAVPYRVEGSVAGVTFTDDGTDAVALIMQAGANELVALAADGVRGSVDLDRPPVAVGAYGDLVYVVHDDPLGRITFYNPANGEQTVSEGFAKHRLVDALSGGL